MFDDNVFTDSLCVKNNGSIVIARLKQTVDKVVLNETYILFVL